MRRFLSRSRVADVALYLCGRRWFPALMAILFVGLSAAGAFADGSPASVTVNSVVDPTTLASSTVTIGGALLVAAIGVVIGFRLAKKFVMWMSGKV